MQNTPDAPVTTRAMRRVQYVLELTIEGLGDQAARSAVELATAGAPSGTYIRLRVGTSIPLWLDSALRDDLSWQIVARDALALERWHDYLDEETS